MTTPSPYPLVKASAPAKPVNLNADERKVLRVLTEDGNEDFGFYSFGAIADAGVRLDRGAIRRACRSLKRKGLTEYGTGLWYECGGMAGSGYRATKAAHAIMEQQQ